MKSLMEKHKKNSKNIERKFIKNEFYTNFWVFSLKISSLSSGLYKKCFIYFFVPFILVNQGSEKAPLNFFRSQRRSTLRVKLFWTENRS